MPLNNLTISTLKKS
jgi:hypothetical protein